jgi:tRNA pseudouridine38-40 synthase
VHALGQVVSYSGPPAVLSAETVPDGFSARHHALSRRYRYRVLARPAPSPFERGRALWWPHAIDLPALEACAAALAGLHDFTAFTPTQTYHQRFLRDVIAASWRRRGDLLEFEIEADSFMRHMNRVLVGTMLEVAGGRRSVRDFERLLTGCPRSDAGATAPPHGLYLAAVRY